MTLRELSGRQRLIALGLVIVMIAGALWWLRPDGGPSATPFPEIGYVREGNEVPHTVLHRNVDPTAYLDDPTTAVSDSSVSTWDGSLIFDDAEVNEYDSNGRYRRRLATTSQQVGIEVAASDWAVWHVDAEGDGTIDLSVFRRPLSDEAALPADEPAGFVTQPYEEFVVNRAGSGDIMAGLYAEGGLHPAVCTSGLFADIGPLNPDEATEILEGGDRTIWCTRPRQQPERLDEAQSEAGQGDISEGDVSEGDDGS